MRRVLIANRGEIALRILRTCHALGIETVAVHSKVDAGLRHLDFATDTVCIDETSYLMPEAIVSAALSRGCDAIHPGYGLLSENPAFARLCAEQGVTFIGPAASLIETMADKLAARRTVADLGLDVIDGLDSPDDADMEAWAKRTGFPVIVKAAHGGGGRGMRLVARAESLAPAVTAARAEAAASFGSDAVYLEQFVRAARHVEVQVLGDGVGNAIHLGTRDCTVQRSYQKLIEEASAPFIEPSVLDELAERCASAAAKMGYAGAGTFEFLYDGQSFRFIEMNARLQVEHAVTEMVTGVDLVAAQIHVADGQSLPSPDSIVHRGHAVECRINAEQIDDDGLVRPSPGRVDEVMLPGGPGIRVDSHLFDGYVVPHHYDSLVAKVIAWGETRRQAIARMAVALEEMRIGGIETNIDWLRAMVTGNAFASGDLTRVADTRKAA